MDTYILQIYKGKNEKWWWSCKAPNGLIIGASSQGYARRWYAIKKAKQSWPNPKRVEIGEQD